VSIRRTSRRAGICHLILPREIPDNVREEMHFTLAERIEDVLSAAMPRVAERLHPVMIA
jgi:ATP-dependent Lon protease